VQTLTATFISAPTSTPTLILARRLRRLDTLGYRIYSIPQYVVPPGKGPSLGEPVRGNSTALTAARVPIPLVLVDWGGHFDQEGLPIWCTRRASPRPQILISPTQPVRGAQNGHDSLIPSYPQGTDARYRPDDELPVLGLVLLCCNQGMAIHQRGRTPTVWGRGRGSPSILCPAASGCPPAGHVSRGSFQGAIACFCAHLH
jgi:hypothetical protein